MRKGLDLLASSITFFLLLSALCLQQSLIFLWLGYNFSIVYNPLNLLPCTLPVPTYECLKKKWADFLSCFFEGQLFTPICSDSTLLAVRQQKQLACLEFRQIMRKTVSCEGKRTSFQESRSLIPAPANLLTIWETLGKGLKLWSLN